MKFYPATIVEIKLVQPCNNQMTEDGSTGSHQKMPVKRHIEPQEIDVFFAQINKAKKKTFYLCFLRIIEPYARYLFQDEVSDSKLTQPLSELYNLRL